MSKKKIIGTIVLGGLMLSAPFAVFAFGSNNNQINNDSRLYINLNEEDLFNRLEYMQAALGLQIEHANELITALDSEDNIDVDRLNEIIVEYAELEEVLATINDDALADDLREAFFEYQFESRDLSREFRDLIFNAFTIEEHNELREEFKAEMDTLRKEFGIEFNGKSPRNSVDDLSDYQRGKINSEMGWNSHGKGQISGSRGKNQGVRN